MGVIRSRRETAWIADKIRPRKKEDRSSLELSTRCLLSPLRSLRGSVDCMLAKGGSDCRPTVVPYLPCHDTATGHSAKRTTKTTNHIGYIDKQTMVGCCEHEDASSDCSRISK